MFLLFAFIACLVDASGWGAFFIIMHVVLE